MFCLIPFFLGGGGLTCLHPEQISKCLTLIALTMTSTFGLVAITIIIILCTCHPRYGNKKYDERQQS